VSFFVAMPHVEWLEIDYPALVRDPTPGIAKLVEFLGAGRLPNEKAMASVVDPVLHRRRS
jgi:LPS sulfotransferase NodH